MADQTPLPLYPGEPTITAYPTEKPIFTIIGAFLLGATFLGAILFARTPSAAPMSKVLLYGGVSVFAAVLITGVGKLDRALHVHRWLRAFVRNNHDLGIRGNDVRRLRRLLVNPPGYICRYAHVEGIAASLAFSVRFPEQHTDTSPLFDRIVLDRYRALRGVPFTT